MASRARTRWDWGRIVLLGCSMLAVSCQDAPAPVEKDYGRELPPGTPALERILDPRLMPDYALLFEQRASWLPALAQSESWFEKPSSRLHFPYRTNDREITHADQVASLKALRLVAESSQTSEEFAGWMTLAFDAYRSVGWDGSGEVLYTGYCEPIFDGSRTPRGRFVHPLHRLPPDLVKNSEGTCLGRRTESGSIVPYYTRAEIMDGDRLRGLELYYLADPFQVYVAQVQGSCRVRLEGGEIVCLGYAGKNEYDYVSIGRTLVKEGRIRSAELSLTTLERYFESYPAELDRLLRKSPSFVFFTEREPGPFGSLGVKVTPYHSIATDKSAFPRGGACVVAAKLPVEGSRDRSAFQRRSLLVFDQDTGGAIRSAGRADLFLGTGDEAKRIAGYTQEEGRLTYLFSKPKPRLPRSGT